jgi:beta-N-acetylhexosaminidase
VALGSRGGDGEPAGGSTGSSLAPGLGLRERIGLVLVSSFDGTRLPAYMRRRLRTGETAGVILFAKNAPSAAVLRGLTRDIQSAARGGALVATDQEGGAIRNVAFAGPVPGQPAQGSPRRVGSLAHGAARRLRALGVNVNLAPVADVASPASVMRARAFPGSARAVAGRVRASVEGHSRGRVGATAKHFPGFGAARSNTDDAPVTIPASRAALDRDLAPFRAAIGARVPLVMASHAVYPSIHGGRIASQSPVVLSTLLRGRLGFEGAIVTDSIEAEAVLRRSSVAVASERSILAGSDLVLMTGSGSWKLVFPHLLRRARRSRRLRARIDPAARRVLALRSGLGLEAPR